MYVTDTDGQVVCGETAEDVVREMIASDRLRRNKPLRSYMARIARRCHVYRGSKISEETAEMFLADLEASGFILRNTIRQAERAS